MYERKEANGGQRVDLAREPIGRALSRSMAPGDAADRGIDAFIEQRHRRRVETEGERAEEAVWAETTRCEEARRRELVRASRLDWWRYLEGVYARRSRECGELADELEGGAA